MENDNYIDIPNNNLQDFSYSEEELSLLCKEWDLDDLEEPSIVEDSNRVHLSLDLSEATYNISFDIIDSQTNAIDQLLKGFRVWDVFHKLFRIHRRTVDMQDLINKNYFEGPRYVVSENGTFMGDPLSFIHLSLYLRASVYATMGRNYRPIGQSVGDDLLLLGISENLANNFNQHIIKTGGKTSKFNSISKNAMTFCESFAYKPSDLNRIIWSYPRESVFGDLIFLDIIKGSILSGKSKVKTTGSSPFFGHAKMLNKQLAYHPLSWVKSRAGAFLWVTNYDDAVRLNSSLASLPEPLGGINLAIGNQVSWNDKNFQDHYLPYFEGILRVSDERAFLSFATLLAGIYKANPKGVPYENNLNKIEELFGSLNLQRVRNINSLIPSYMEKKGIGDRLRFVGKVLRLASIDQLINEFSRRQAFLELWEEPNTVRPFVVLPIKAARTRHKQAWEEIRRSIRPIKREDQRSSSIIHLANLFKDRLWNVFYSKDDICFEEEFGGMPSLYVNYEL